MGGLRRGLSRVTHEWSACQKCVLCKDRTHVVVGTGSLPCDIMLLGEGPGKNEDLLGEPFVGRAGGVLRKAVTDAVQESGSVRWFTTNVVGCRPPDNRVPRKEEIEACWPRVRSLYGEARPKVVVALGATAARLLGRFRCHTMKTFHPSFVARRGGVESTEYQRLVRDLQEAIERV